MSVILKYQVRLGITPDVLWLPHGAEVLSAATQGPNGDVKIWASVPDQHAAKVQRGFIVVMTGQECDLLDARFIDTVFHDGYVGHVFEVPI